MAIALDSNISNTPKNFNGYAPFFKKNALVFDSEGIPDIYNDILILKTKNLIIPIYYYGDE